MDIKFTIAIISALICNTLYGYDFNSNLSFDEDALFRNRNEVLYAMQCCFGDSIFNSFVSQNLKLTLTVYQDNFGNPTKLQVNPSSIKNNSFWSEKLLKKLCCYLNREKIPLSVPYKVESEEERKHIVSTYAATCTKRVAVTLNYSNLFATDSLAPEYKWLKRYRNSLKDTTSIPYNNGIHNSALLFNALLHTCGENFINEVINGNDNIKFKCKLNNDGDIISLDLYPTHNQYHKSYKKLLPKLVAFFTHHHTKFKYNKNSDSSIEFITEFPGEFKDLYYRYANQVISIRYSQLYFYKLLCAHILIRDKTYPYMGLTNTIIYKYL